MVARVVLTAGLAVGVDFRLGMEYGGRQSPDPAVVTPELHRLGPAARNISVETNCDGALPTS